MRTQISAVVESPSRMVLREFPIPAIGPEEMLLRVELVAICGSDRHHYQGGAYHVFPKILGHEMVGFVDRIGETAARQYRVAEGDRVVVEPYIPCWRCRYCATGYYQLCPQRRIYGVNLSSEKPPHLWGAYGQYLYVAPGSRVHRIAADVPPEAATLSSVIGNGVRWVASKGRVRVGEPVVVVGPGAIGLASVIAAHYCGAGPIIVAGLPEDQPRLAFARRCGATDLLVVGEEDLPARVRAICGGELAPLVVEASGSNGGVVAALSLVRPAGRCVLAGTTGRPTAVNFDPIVRSEIEILGGLGQSWDVEPAIRIIESGRYPIAEMVAAVHPLEEAEPALQSFIQRPRDFIRIALRPQ